MVNNPYVDTPGAARNGRPQPKTKTMEKTIEAQCVVGRREHLSDNWRAGFRVSSVETARGEVEEIIERFNNSGTDEPRVLVSCDTVKVATIEIVEL